MIPPAFTEVWKLMFQCVFNHFEHDTDDSAQPPVTNDQRLQSQLTPNFITNCLRFDKTIANTRYTSNGVQFQHSTLE